MNFCIVNDKDQYYGKFEKRSDAYKRLKALSSEYPGIKFYMYSMCSEFFTPTEAQKAEKEFWS